jgi:CRISPR-associated protein Csd1
MILQALNDYYERKCAHLDPRERLPDFGFEQKEIPFLLELQPDGTPLQLVDTRTANDKKKLIARSYRVPQGIKKTSGIAANLLWDTVEYALGIDTKGKPERVVEQHAAFRQRLHLLPADVQQDIGISAVNRFLDQVTTGQLETFSAWPQALESNALISFRLQGDAELVCQRPALVRAAKLATASEDSPIAMCLVTGRQAPIERLHASIKGVWGAQTSGANVVSFNARAFESYGKTERQGENAPVSQAAAFAYTTALNHLLRRDSRQRVQVGDASTVFWADKPTDFEEFIPGLFSDNPDAGADAARALHQAMHTGQWGGADGGTVMHVLGLAPNAARVSIRFYHHKPLKELGRDIQQHFDDLEMTRGPNDAQYPSLFRLLAAVAVQNKADNIPPNLGGAIVDAVFSGPEAPYPALWLNAAVGRCRAEQNVNYLRAAAIKACLNRQIRRRRNDPLTRSSTQQEKDFQPMLDPSNTHTSYRLGRLFAVLERAQEIANPGINATIRDRYYGAASSTPVAVFTTLLRLEKAHLKKMPSGQANWIESLIGEVLEPVADFPKHLSLLEQGRFALGYYQQRQFFFTKKTTPEAVATDSTNPTPSGA